MSIHYYINQIHKYLYSIRFLNQENNHLLVFDLKFPKKWDIMKYMTQEEQIDVKFQKEVSNLNFYSFFCIYEEKNVDDLYLKIIYVIDKCVEEEKKIELLNSKIKELKERFNEMTVEELEQLNFKNKEDEKKLEASSSS